MKKLLVVLLTLAMVASLFVACAPAVEPEDTATANETAATANETASATEANSENTEILIWSFVSTEALRNLQSTFCEEITQNMEGVTARVEFLPFSDFKKYVSTGAATGSLPDIVLIDNCDMIAYSAMGIFADLTEKIKDWDEFKNCNPQLSESCQYDGKWYGLPFYCNMLDIYYNKDILAAAGVDPAGIKTMDDLYTAAKACTTADHYGFLMSCPASEESTYQFEPFLWGNGGDVYKINDPAGVATLTYFANMIQEGIMSRECITWSQSDTAEQFASGNVAMMIHGCWKVNAYRTNYPDLNFGVFEVPAGSVSQATVFGGSNVAIVNNDKVDTSLKVMHYLVNEAQVSRYCALSGSAPGVLGALESEAYAPLVNDPDYGVFYSSIVFGRTRPADVNYPSVSAAIQTCLQEVFSLSRTPQEAADSAQATIDGLAGK